MSPESASTWMDGLAVGDTVGVHIGKVNIVAGRVVRLTSTLVVVEIPGWASLQHFRRKDGLRVGEGDSIWARTRILQITEHVQAQIDRCRLLLELNRAIDGHRRDRWERVSDSVVRQVAELLKGGVA